METSKPIALTIDLGIVRKECPPHLADRLSSKSPPTSPTNKASQVLTPPSSPEKLAVATKLHEAHLQVRTPQARPPPLDKYTTPSSSCIAGRSARPSSSSICPCGRTPFPSLVGPVPLIAPPHRPLLTCDDLFLLLPPIHAGRQGPRDAGRRAHRGGPPSPPSW